MPGGYRDHVVASFNTDKPFNLFAMEQVAGDLMPAQDDRQRAERAVATGFLAIGPKSHNERSRLQFDLELADEQIDAVTQAFLGLTVACARCHDHKFDSISQRDYYALGRHLSQHRDAVRHHPGDPEQSPHDRATGVARRGEPAGDEPEVIARRPGRPGAATQVAAGPTAGDCPRRAGGDPGERRVPPPANPAPLASRPGWRTSAPTGNRGLEQWPPATDACRPTARSTPAASRARPAEVVPRGLPQVLVAGDGRVRSSGSGRLELAEFLGSDRNPLTARVWVNRVWLHLVRAGAGADTGQLRSQRHSADEPAAARHAGRAVHGRWVVDQATGPPADVDAGVRADVRFDARNQEVDPENTLVWRASNRRLDAEGIHDAMLVVAGKLETAPPVGSLVARVGDGPGS